MNRSAGRYRLAMMVGALGVVYGDIGTSPLYALRECFHGRHGVSPLPENILGVVSLIIWSLTLLVSTKYLTVVLRADNQGEGGILALLALIGGTRDDKPKAGIRFLLRLGIFGAALLYGDGIITPAVSVLGAVEGLEVAAPGLQPYVTPIAVAVLVGLFSVQRYGTGRVGMAFGPVMVLWFCVLGVLGVRGIASAPQILQALSPHHAVLFLVHNGQTGFLVLGSVFLAVTGAEALYADLGHFGKSPIRRAWFAIVFPALLLNYLGEGALLLTQPEAARNPFYLLAPSWAVVPLVCLSTLAAVIASQALISGVYSLTMQAIQMGYLPRIHILHTSHVERGQIFIPQVNSFLMVACVGLVLGFQSSSRLAGAYGIAVALTMVITTILLFAVARHRWNWPWLRAFAVCGVFLIIELAFAAANAAKVLDGGWFPLVVGLGLFAVMLTWKTGRQVLRAKLSESYLPFDLFLKDLQDHKIHRVPGTAVFLSGNPNGAPLALLHNLRHNKVLHERMLILTVVTKEVPMIGETGRLQIEQLRPDIHRVTGHYGFMEQPNIPALLDSCAAQGLKVDLDRTTFFLSRETIIPSRSPGMAQWRRKLFATLSRNAQSAAAFFRIPPNRVVELGMQVEL